MAFSSASCSTKPSVHLGQQGTGSVFDSPLSRGSAATRLVQVTPVGAERLILHTAGQKTLSVREYAGGVGVVVCFP